MNPRRPPKPQFMAFNEWLKENHDLVLQVKKDAAASCPSCDGDGEVMCFHCGVGTEECDDCHGVGFFNSAEEVPFHVVNEELKDLYGDALAADKKKWDAWHKAVSASQ